MSGKGNNFTPWLWTIGRNIWIDGLRSSGRQVPTVPLDDIMGVPLEQIEWFRTAFSRAWGRLSPEEQHILSAIYGEGRKREEVAKEYKRKEGTDELGISQPTLRQKERKAKEKLERYLAEEGISVEPINPEDRKEEEVEGQGPQETQKEADEE